MITCYRLSQIISEFIDGELSEDVCVEIRQHIAFCPDCRREHEQFLKLLTFFHCNCTIQITESTHLELMQVIFEEFEKPVKLEHKPRKSLKKRKIT
jgi:anti-sigma factor RsiW